MEMHRDEAGALIIRTGEMSTQWFADHVPDPEPGQEAAFENWIDNQYETVRSGEHDHDTGWEEDDDEESVCQLALDSINEDDYAIFTEGE